MSGNLNKNRIVKNSLLLYVRMLFTMLLNLWTTRLVLANLGVENMGVYGVVGSIVVLASTFTSGITTAIHRFITFEIGKTDGKPNLVFCSSLNIIFILSAFVFLFLEGMGVYMLYHIVNIPVHCENAAFWVLQLSILTFVVDLISIPYNVLVIAHEKIDAFAVISILQTVLTFGAVYVLTWFDNRLLVYAIMMATISVVIRITYQVYCHYKFDETRYHLVIDKELFRQLGKFAGVSTVSGILYIVSSQGIVFVINWTFGVTVNAVYNIALQLKNSALSFAFNLFKAIAPQITKTYASGEIEAHKKLVYSGIKLDAFLLFFIIIPCLIRTEYIMNLWLGNVPRYVVEFARCSFIISLASVMFEPIRTSVLATNRIIKFLIVPDTFYLLVLPISYAICKIWNNPVIFIVVVLCMEVLTCLVRVYFAVKVSPLVASILVKKVAVPVMWVGVVDFFICYGLCQIFPLTLIGLILLLVFNSLSLVGIIYIWGLDKNEKYICISVLNKVKDIIRH